MKHTASTLAIAASLALLGSGAMAQGAGTATTTTPGGAATATPAPKSGAAATKLARSDVGFLKDAAKAGMAEVQASQLAVQKATDPSVKAFAQKMVDDHGKAHDELKALAQSKGVDLPDDPSMMQKGKMKLLSSADGATFDKRYADSMGVKAHEDTVKLFQKAASNAKDADVKAFAAKTLPTLQEHLKMAQDLHTTTSAKK
jgi:putative membrane protein